MVGRLPADQASSKGRTTCSSQGNADPSPRASLVAGMVPDLWQTRWSFQERPLWHFRGAVQEGRPNSLPSIGHGPLVKRRLAQRIATEDMPTRIEPPARSMAAI